MKRFQRNGRDAGGSVNTGALMPALTVAILLSGCSADVGRFDFPTFNLNGDTSTTNAIPTPSEPVSGGPSLSGAADRSTGGGYGGAYVPPRSSHGGNGVDVAALPEPAAPTGGYERPAYGAGTPAPYQPPRATYSPSGAAPVAAIPTYAKSQPSRTSTPAAAPGDSIEVQRGDTVYGLARRHGVTVKDLMAANNMTAANIKPGQRLRIPGGTSAVAAPLEAKRETATPVVAAPRVAAAAPGDWDGSYTIQPGDSLYGIARTHKVRVADLQSANNITNPRQLKPGMVLKVPGRGGVTNTAPTPTPTLTQAPRATETEAPRAIQSTTQPTLINGEKKVAALDTGGVSDATSGPARTSTDARPASKPDKTAAVSPSQVGAGKLRWPSKGKVISGFGQRPDGTHNDGINIAVPQGTDVHAAEEGEVAYAGSELKGYGNLILVRHDNGWVTAYAHSETMLVKRGDKVRRGDVIAKAGKTGQVDQPQLHFELRQGSKPVDPLPYLDRL